MMASTTMAIQSRFTSARRVEQKPEDEQDDRSDGEQIDHFLSSPPIFTANTTEAAFRRKGRLKTAPQSA
jgi:hypothetical protein